MSLLAASATGAAEPSFDCTRTDSAVARLICADEGLAALDREAVRLLALARAGMDAPALLASEAAERDWLARRESCFLADDAHECVVAAHVLRIRDLRAQHPAARADDGGISIGPLPLDCGDGGPVAVTYVDGTPPHALLDWPDKALILSQTPAASGARYQAVTEAGLTVFRTKADAARLERPDAPPRDCTIGSR